MRNIIKKILKESTPPDVIEFEINDVVVVNGRFQGKDFNNSYGQVVKSDTLNDIVGIRFENWNAGHAYGRNGINYWEFYMGGVYSWRPELNTGYTIKKVDHLDMEDIFNRMKP